MSVAEQRQQVEAAPAALGWEKDRFGHFKSPSGGVRVKMQATSVRLERKVSYPATEYCVARTEWFKITGSYLRDVRVLDDWRVQIGSKVLKKLEEKSNG